MNDEEALFARLRQTMVRQQIAARGVRDIRVLEAMATVPRHRFVPPESVPGAYDDRPMPIGQGQTISQPYIVAAMTERLELLGSERVLEIGTGSGYQTAVLAELAQEVFTIEIVESLVRAATQRFKELRYDNIQVKSGDGYHGWPEAAPFDGIIVTAAAPYIPDALKAQLKDGGRLVIPVGEEAGDQVLMRFRRQGRELRADVLEPVRFVPMRGEIEAQNA